MSEPSDYIIYVDESGDHGLKSIDPESPIFTLVFCIFRVEDYKNQIIPTTQKFKNKYWGHDNIILHERDIRKPEKDDYKFLTDRKKREVFMAEIGKLIEEAKFHLIATVIRKDELIKRYKRPSNPYELAMLFCMERAHKWLCEQNQTGKKVHIICEARGKKEDRDLELEFRRIRQNSAQSTPSKMNFSAIDYRLKFQHKKENDTGLQLADLVVRPIGKSILRPEQTNRAIDIIKQKYLKTPKIFP